MSAVLEFEPLRACYLCGLGEFERFESTTVHGVGLHYGCCQGCGLICMNPRPTEAGMSEFYGTQYWQHGTSVQGDPAAGFRKQQLRARLTLGLIESRIDAIPATPLCVLDIGSSWGAMLAEVRRRLGTSRPLQLYGIEPSADASRYAAREHGVDIIGTTVHDLALAERRFDVIILSHVLEHLYQPAAALQLLRRSLSADGFIYVEVPNFYGHRSYSPFHLICFTRNTLRRMLVSQGLTVSRLYVHGAADKNLSALAEPIHSDGPVIEPESMAAIRKQRRRSQSPDLFTRLRRRWARMVGQP